MGVNLSACSIVAWKKAVVPTPVGVNLASVLCNFGCRRVVPTPVGVNPKTWTYPQVGG